MKEHFHFESDLSKLVEDYVHFVASENDPENKMVKYITLGSFQRSQYLRGQQLTSQNFLDDKQRLRLAHREWNSEAVCSD